MFENKAFPIEVKQIHFNPTVVPNHSNHSTNHSNASITNITNQSILENKENKKDKKNRSTSKERENEKKSLKKSSSSKEVKTVKTNKGVDIPKLNLNILNPNDLKKQAQSKSFIGDMGSSKILSSKSSGNMKTLNKSFCEESKKAKSKSP